MKRFLSGLITILLLLSLLPGCAEEAPVTPTEPEPAESRLWETMPQLTYGVMEYEKLEVLPWYSGRTEATSLYTLAETATGFYQSCIMWLFYADKADLANWIPVCNDPTCDHYVGCNAHIACGRFLITDGRICYEASPQDVPIGADAKSGGFVLASKNPDGTFCKVEYVLEDMLVSGKTATSSLLLQDQWLCQKFELTPEGTQSGRLYCVTRDGPRLLAEQNDFDPLNAPPGIHDAAYRYTIYGDRCFTTGILDGTGKTVYRMTDGQPEALDILDLPLMGSYLSGNTLRFFRPGEGYYDRNLETGEEIFLAVPHLENSFSCILLPNCIIESSLLFRESLETREPRMLHALAYYDGEVWHDVILPEEWEKAGLTTVLAPLAVTSDSIFFSGIDTAKSPMEFSVQLYRISLSKEEKVLEYVGEIVTPQ